MTCPLCSLVSFYSFVSLAYDRNRKFVMKAYWQKDLSIRFLSLKQIQETIQEHKIKTEAKIQTNNEIFKL